LYHSDVNAFLRVFMDSFIHCFEIAFPYMKKRVRNFKNKNWPTMGLIISCKKMKGLNSLKKVTHKNETLGYIKNYNKIYKKVLKEAKKRDNDRYVTKASNKTKAMWQLINKKIGRTKEDDNKLELKLGNNLITNPKEITEILNEYFTNITTDLKKPSTGRNNNLSQKINTCVTSVFIYPVTEEEVVNRPRL